MIRILMSACLAALLCLSTASADPANAQAARKPRVVATFSILGDMAANVGAGRIDLAVLVRHDADAHDFQPGPADAKAVAQADIFLVNGRGFDDWATRLAKSSGGKARIVKVAAAVKARPQDPHAWQDVSNALLYVDAIEKAFAKVSPSDAAAFRKAADAYRAELKDLHREILDSVSAIPVARRNVITTHDAFGFFGRAYGIRFLAPLGLSTHAQASAKSLSVLVRQIRRERISALFLENIADNRLIEQIARETGASVGGRLYSDALSGKDGPAATYVAMMRQNAKLLTAAMAKGS